MSDIEGKAAREVVSECGQRASFNAANGMNDIEGSEPLKTETLNVEMLKR